MIYKNFDFLEKSFGAQHSRIELGLIVPSFFQFCCQRKAIFYDCARKFILKSKNYFEFARKSQPFPS